MHMGVNKAIGFFLPPDVKVELDVNCGGGGGKAALFLPQNPKLDAIVLLYYKKGFWREPRKEPDFYRKRGREKCGS